MKLILLKNSQLRLNQARDETNQIMYFTEFLDGRETLIPGCQTEARRSLCAKLKDYVDKAQVPGAGVDGAQWSWRVTIFPNAQWQHHLVVEGVLLQHIQKFVEHTFPNSSIKVEVSLKNLIPQNQATLTKGSKASANAWMELRDMVTIKTRRMTIMTENEHMAAQCGDVIRLPSFSWLTSFSGGIVSHAKCLIAQFSVRLILEGTDWQELDSSVVVLNKKIGKGDSISDVVIIADNGARLDTHKCFLSVWSPVLAAMFQGNFEESRSNVINMDDISETAVKAFLAFVYSMDTKEAQRDCYVAFELLYTGEKYDIPQLKNSMKQILLDHESHRFSVELALKLFVFVQGMDKWGTELLWKSVRIVKRFRGHSSLKNLDCYQKLFKENPLAAMELCEYLAN